MSVFIDRIALSALFAGIAAPPLVAWSVWRAAKRRGTRAASWVQGASALVYLTYSALVFIRLQHTFVDDDPSEDAAFRNAWLMVGLFTTAVGLCLAYCAIREGRAARLRNARRGPPSS